MNFCSHGFSEMECPHCTVGNRVRPTPIIELAATELPMEVPSISGLNAQNTDVDTPLYANVRLQSIAPQKLVRELNLRESRFNANSGMLFKQRLEIINKNVSAEQRMQITPVKELFDLKKKFTHA